MIPTREDRYLAVVLERQTDWTGWLTLPDSKEWWWNVVNQLAEVAGSYTLCTRGGVYSDTDCRQLEARH